MIFDETLHKGYGQRFEAQNILFDQKTDHQHLVIFENSIFGRVMMLDGVVQTTERDEFVYHEMFAHVPLSAHKAPKRVLIVGGGDGGLLREVCRHQVVESITMVEIDDQVVELSKRYLPNHSQGAFSDSRLHLVIQDASEYLKEADAGSYDVILCDSTDPIGPAEALFASPFYADMKRCLAKDGIVVTQNGVSFLQLDEIATTAKRMGQYFAKQTFYAAPPPTYIGGSMYCAWGSDEPGYLQVSEAYLAERVAPFQDVLRYYHPRLHRAAFCLPRYVERTIEGNG